MRRNRYALAEPKLTVRAVYFKRLIKKKLFNIPQLTKNLCQGFKETNAAAALSSVLTRWGGACPFVTSYTVT